MGKTLLITGGARSGKSAIAEARTLQFGQPAVYIATARILDDEMRERVAAHRQRRGPEWSTVSEPVELARALLATDGQGPRLVDCLTLWITNLMIGELDWEAATDGLLRALQIQDDPVVLVTSEVGMGIVPDNALARSFRDIAGVVNQRVAAEADEVYFAVSGLELKVKPNAHT